MELRIDRVGRFIVPALLILVLAGCVPSGYRTSRTLEQTATHLEQTPLTVVSRNGSIKVIADDTVSEVRITAKLTCGGGTQAEADQRVQEANLEVTRSTSRRLTVKPVFPGGVQNGDGASITVRLPDAEGVNVDTSNGAIVLEGLTGEADVDTSNGSITLEDHHGSATVKTSNGSITLEDHHGSATLRTSNGSVTVTGHIGPLDIDTSNGRVRALQVEGPARIDTSNGSITFSLAPDHAGPIKLDTSNGSISATVGPAFVGTVRLDTSNAGLSITDRSGRIRSQILHKTNGKLEIGEGGELSIIETSNGSIAFVIEG